MIQNWVNIESVRHGNALKMKVFDLNIETPKHFSDQTLPPIQPEMPKITLKLVNLENAS